jgi:hypothetical protein
MSAPDGATAAVDVFISYAHLDESWVIDFASDLDAHLSRQIGRKLNVWFDRWRIPRDAPDDLVRAEIQRALTTAKILLMITSALFVPREWFKIEYEAFAAEGELVVEGQSRVVKVLVGRVEDAQLPALMQKQLGVPFYTDEATADGDRVTRGSETYNRSIAELSQGIGKMLWNMRPLHEREQHRQAQLERRRRMDAYEDSD